MPNSKTIPTKISIDSGNRWEITHDDQARQQHQQGGDHALFPAKLVENGDQGKSAKADTTGLPVPPARQ